MGHRARREREVPDARVEREEDDLGLREVDAQHASDLEAGHPGHRVVEHDQIGMKLERFLRGLVPVSGFADDLEVGIRLDERPKALADSKMVVGDENALWHVGKSRFSPLHGHRTGGGRSM